MHFQTKHFRIAIIGSGPAAYSAAAYCQNAVLFEGSFTSLIGPGGQLTTTSDVDNFPGFVSGTNGPALMGRMRNSCSSCIVEDEIVFVEKVGHIFKLYTDDFSQHLRKTKDGVILENRENFAQNSKLETFDCSEESQTVLNKNESITGPKIHQIDFSLSKYPEISENNNEATIDLKQPAKKQLNATIKARETKEKTTQLTHVTSEYKNDETSQEMQTKTAQTDNYSRITKHLEISPCENEANSISQGRSIDSPCLYTADLVIIATGANAKRLYVPGTNDDEFWQRGISTCAVCDGYSFSNKKVIVIGGGDSAMEEALYLANIASEVVLVHRSQNFRARVDMLEKVKKHPKITVLTNHVLVKAYGDTTLRGCVFQGQTEIDIQTEGLFFAIGHTPNTDFLRCEKTNEYLVHVDKDGFIKTDSNQRTNIEGVLAAGDVQDKVYRQAITAAASGARAGLTAMKILHDRGLE